MIRKDLFLLATGLVATFGVVASAQAADAAVCYSGLQTLTSTPDYQSYPQLSNSTRFNCQAGGVAYTIPQLAQRGWTISQVVPTIYSTSISASGAVTRQRQQLIIQK